MTSKWQELRKKIETYLVAPGNGVHTVNTARDKKKFLHETLYGSAENVDTRWKESLDQLPMAPKTTILGVCSDAGGGIQRGANWGPLFLRQTLLQSGEELPAFDIGDIKVNPHLLHDKYLNNETIEKCQMSMFGAGHDEFPVSPLSITEDFCRNFYETFPQKRLFAIGGDHSVSYPLVKTYLAAKKKQGKKVALIHFDAHTDLLVERLGIDLNFASWTSHILDGLDSPNLCFQIGIRSSGKPKEHWEKTFGINQYWADEVKAGPSSIAEDIIKKCTEAGVDELYVSFDIDALDSDYASATGTPEPNGLSPHEPMVIMQELYENFPITGADMVEIAPMVNAGQGNQLEPETTLMVAASLSTFLIQAMSNN